MSELSRSRFGARRSVVAGWRSGFGGQLFGIRHDAFATKARLLGSMSVSVRDRPTGVRDSPRAVRMRLEPCSRFARFCSGLIARTFAVRVILVATIPCLVGEGRIHV